ncbi:MAG TPA: TlpA disulfide reductase family protein [Candidatus Polarisedimenticolaceae bacterium]|nr:TlpA disulfide reductase family protein [Candidatus Polarisedimenticolaceae bacterium]
MTKVGTRRSALGKLVLVLALVAPAPAHAGQTAPEFAFEDINPNSATFGDKLALSARYAERGLVLNFLASWCSYCFKELPELEQLNTAGVAPVLGVAADEYDGPGRLREMLGQLKLSFPVLLVPEEQIASMGESYGHRILPATYLIDKTGAVRSVFEGAVTGRDLTREIQRTLRPARD